MPLDPRSDSATEYVEAFDSNSHRYIIPADKRSEWEEWCEISYDDERSWEEPSFAKRIDGATIVFTGYRLE